jgi:hypothetical protein
MYIHKMKLLTFTQIQMINVKERENDSAYNTNERLAFVMMMNRRRL